MHHFPSGVEIQVVLLLRMRTCCLDPSIIISFRGVSGLLNSIWSEEVIDFIFASFSWSSHSSLCRFCISCWGQGSIKLLSLPVFLPVAKRCSSLVSISFFCVFWSSIVFLLFPSVAWLPQCFSPCIQSILLHKKNYWTCLVCCRCMLCQTCRKTHCADASRWSEGPHSTEPSMSKTQHLVHPPVWNSATLLFRLTF